MTIGNRGDWLGAAENRAKRDYSHSETPHGVWEVDLSIPSGWTIASEALTTAQVLWGGPRCPNGVHVHYEGAGSAATKGIVWPIMNADGDFTCEMEAEIRPYNTGFQLLGLCMVDNLTPSNTLLVWFLGVHTIPFAWRFEYGAGFTTTVVASDNNSSLLYNGRGWGAITRAGTNYVSGVSADGRAWTYRGGVAQATLGFTPRFFGFAYYDNVATPKDYFVHRLRQINRQYSFVTGGSYAPGMGSQIELPTDQMT